MIKAIVYDAKKNISIREYPTPILEPGEATLKIKRAGICGSDMVAWQGGFNRIVEPVVLGHEFIGTIHEISEVGNDKKFSVGERVVAEPLISCGVCEACKKGFYNVCRNLKVIGLDEDGGFASFVKVPIYRLHRLPDTLSDDKAALCEPVAVAVHMVRRSKLKVGDNIAVMGIGPIGLLVAMVARKAGAAKIILTDINQYRLGLAREMGFEAVNGGKGVLENFMNYLGEEGADISFELAANINTLKLALDITKCRGTILSGGIFKDPPPLELQQLTLKEQNMMGSRVYTFKDFEVAINLLTQADFNIEKLITKKIHVEEAIEKGFEAIKNGEQVMKVLIDFEEV